MVIAIYLQQIHDKNEGKTCHYFDISHSRQSCSSINKQRALTILHNHIPTSRYRADHATSFHPAHPPPSPSHPL